MNIYNYIHTLTNSPNTVILEAGLHLGEDTLKILDIIPLCRYFGFEPDRRNIDYILDIGLNKHITLEPKALDASCGKKTFYMSNSNKGWSGSSSLNKPKLHLDRFSHVSFDTTDEVETTTIDSVVNEYKLDHIDFIWLDTQGSELEILKGAQNSLGKIKAIYFEYYDEEIYENQPKLDKILGFLGKNWEVLEKDSTEVLVLNSKFST